MKKSLIVLLLTTIFAISVKADIPASIHFYGGYNLGYTDEEIDEAFDTGIMVGGGAEWRFENGGAAFFTIDYSLLKSDSDFFQLGESFEGETKVSYFSFIGGYRYRFSPASTISPFIGVAAGLSGGDVNGGDEYTGEDESEFGGFTAQLLAGIEIFANKKHSMTIEGRYILSDLDANEDTSWERDFDNTGLSLVISYHINFGFLPQKELDEPVLGGE